MESTQWTQGRVASDISGDIEDTIFDTFHDYNEAIDDYNYCYPLDIRLSPGSNLHRALWSLHEVLVDLKAGIGYFQARSSKRNGEILR